MGVFKIILLCQRCTGVGGQYQEVCRTPALLHLMRRAMREGQTLHVLHVQLPGFFLQEEDRQKGIKQLRRRVKTLQKIKYNVNRQEREGLTQQQVAVHSTSCNLPVKSHRPHSTQPKQTKKAARLYFHPGYPGLTLVLTHKKVFKAYHSEDISTERGAQHLTLEMEIET